MSRIKYGGTEKNPYVWVKFSVADWHKLKQRANGSKAVRESEICAIINQVQAR